MTRSYQVALVAVAALVTGCTLAPAIARDTRVEITAPADGSAARLPLVVTWRAERALEGRSFAVLVDRIPPRPGATLTGLVPEQAGCRRTPSCRQRWFEENLIVVTTAGRATFKQVARRQDVARADRDLHDVVIILLDDDGRRDGEAAWWHQVRVSQ